MGAVLKSILGRNLNQEQRAKPLGNRFDFFKMVNKYVPISIRFKLFFYFFRPVCKLIFMDIHVDVDASTRGFRLRDANFQLASLEGSNPRTTLSATP